MSGVWLTNNMVSAVLPGLLSSHVGPHLGAMLIESLTIVVAFPLFGMLSQRVGRRVFYVGYGFVITILGSAAYVAVLTVRAGFPVTVALTALVGVTVLGTFGPVAAYLTELFPSHIRATGFGVGYSLALVLPAFYAFYLAGLAAIVASFLAPVVVVVVGGLLVSLGGFRGPETREVEMGGTSVRNE